MMDASPVHLKNRAHSRNGYERIYIEASRSEETVAITADSERERERGTRATPEGRGEMDHIISPGAK